jgi:hypothetical protein
MQIRKSIKLSADLWLKLESIAADVQAIAPPGQTTGQPSWRTLITEIAKGNLTVTRKEQDKYVSQQSNDS